MNAVLHSIYRYPVKSMGGQTLTTTELTANGIPGDRSWAVKEGEGGAIRGGKRSPELMNCSTRVISEPSAQQSSPAVEIGLPDGTFIRTDDDQVNARLSALVESPVSLWPLMPADQLEFYQRQAGEPGANIDPETLLREVFARTADEPLPDLSQFPPELFQYESPPGTYFDAYPLLLLSRNALAQMQQAAPESNFDVRRFRPSLLIDVTAESGSPDDAFPEQAWAGKTLKLGGATLKIEMECPRCIMTIHGFADLPRDPSIMRSLVRENAGNLGVYATVLEPGAISVGDQLQVV